MAKHIHLVIYPGEGTSGTTTIGTIYAVVGDKVESYPMAGGPPPGKGYKDPNQGGHTAGVTPAGHFVLDQQEHHTTQGWPMSVIPWGAQIREHEGEMQYKVGEHWKTATGPKGTVTLAAMQYQRRSGKHPTLAATDAMVHRLFYDRSGRLFPVWRMNDFGNWSWNLKKNGARSAYYIHTTPVNEDSPTSALEQSHGCIHIRPADRDDMMRKGYLAAGVPVEIKPYGQKGPPR